VLEGTHFCHADTPNLAMLPAAGEPRLQYYELTEGSGAVAKDGSRVVVSRG